MVPPDHPYDSDFAGDGQQASGSSQQFGWSDQDVWSKSQWRSQNPDAKVYPPPPEYFREAASNWRTPYADDVSLPGDVQRPANANAGEPERRAARSVLDCSPYSLKWRLSASSSSPSPVR